MIYGIAIQSFVLKNGLHEPIYHSLSITHFFQIDVCLAKITSRRIRDSDFLFSVPIAYPYGVTLWAIINSSLRDFGTSMFL